jgi:hypothetical protein
MKKIETTRSETEALAFLDKTASELSAATDETTAELHATQRSVDAHQNALNHYKATGGGLTPAIAAVNFFRGISELIGGRVTPLGASAADETRLFFDGRKAQLEQAARAKYIRTNARAIASACQVIVTARTANRDAWRNQIGDQIASLVKLQTLTAQTRETGAQTEQRLIELENALADRDAEHQEATRLAARLASNYGSDDIIDIYNGATGFARQMQPYEVSVSLAEEAA